MAPSYTLKYFNCMGLVEPIRYLLAYGNVQYENIVISDAEWMKIQKVVPFGKLPTFEVDGKVLFHSVAICKYLAKIVGLLPVNELEVAELDAMVDVIYELGWQVMSWQQQMNLELKNVMGKELIEVLIPRLFVDLEEILKKKGSFLGGMKLSWADFFVVGILESVEKMLNKSLFSKYPLLQQLMLDVQNVPAIKSYISKRPIYKC